jgi:hypothetical protein
VPGIDRHQPMPGTFVVVAREIVGKSTKSTAAGQQVDAVTYGTRVERAI